MLSGEARFLVVEASGLDHPGEDVVAYGAPGMWACVVDGITRDRYEADGESPAYRAARVLADEVTETLNQSGNRTFHSLREAFEKGNRAVMELNERLDFVDHRGQLTPDCAGAVAAAAMPLDKHTLAIAYLGDCAVRVVSPDGRIAFATEDQTCPMRRYIAAREFVDQAERNRYVRNEIRNNPNATDEAGRRIGFGAFTGDPNAMRFLQLDTLITEPESLVTIFTDGAAGLWHDAEFTTMLRDFQLGADANETAKMIHRHVESLRSGFGEFHDDLAMIAFIWPAVTER